MTKSPSYSSKEIIRLLEKKGFVLDRVKGSHKIFILQSGKRRVIVPMHNKDLPKGTFHSILKQAGIDKNEI